jgi:hypothetical protein
MTSGPKREADVKAMAEIAEADIIVRRSSRVRI